MGDRQATRVFDLLDLPGDAGCPLRLDVVTPQRAICSRTARASNLSKFKLSAQACAFQGAKKLDQACFAQPGELRFKCTSPGRNPSQYIVDRWPTG